MITSFLIIQDVYETTMDSKATLVNKINLWETFNINVINLLRMIPFSDIN